MTRVSVLIYRSMAFGAARRWRYGRLSRCAEMRGSVEARWAWPFTLLTSGRHSGSAAKLIRALLSTTIETAFSVEALLST